MKLVIMKKKNRKVCEVMKKICKKCKYFTQDKDDKELGYGQCECEKMIYDTAYCRKPKEKDLLFYMDYEGYNAGIEVGEEFGCIHFNKKELNNLGDDDCE